MSASAVNEENAVIHLTLSESDDGFTIGLDISQSLIEIGPDRAAMAIHGWVDLLNDLMGDMLDHVDNDPINMYIH